MKYRCYAVFAGLSTALALGAFSSVAVAAPSSSQVTLQESLYTADNSYMQGDDDSSSLQSAFVDTEEEEVELPTITAEMGPMLADGELLPYVYNALNTAYSVIGCPYVYGATGPNAFDCSGLVCYCFGWDRGRTTYDMIDSLVRDGSWKTSMDELQVGDLVFPSSGHVGIYTGNGMMIHAPRPGKCVCEAPVYAFIGGGTF